MTRCAVLSLFLSQEDWKLSPQSLETFVQLWSQYDDGSGTITPKDLEDLLMHLDPPLGLGPEVNSKDVLRYKRETRGTEHKPDLMVGDQQCTGAVCNVCAFTPTTGAGQVGLA